MNSFKRHFTIKLNHKYDMISCFCSKRILTQHLCHLNYAFLPPLLPIGPFLSLLYFLFFCPFINSSLVPSLCPCSLCYNSVPAILLPSILPTFSPRILFSVSTLVISVSCLFALYRYILSLYVLSPAVLVITLK